MQLYIDQTWIFGRISEAKLYNMELCYSDENSKRDKIEKTNQVEDIF